jgi:hypothetical protein
MQFGITTDVSVSADYDGNGKADIAVFRNGAWYLQRSTTGFVSFEFDTSGTKPFPAPTFVERIIIF